MARSAAQSCGFKGRIAIEQLDMLFSASVFGGYKGVACWRRDTVED
jgi:hypothetical protein